MNLSETVNLYFKSIVLQTNQYFKLASICNSGKYQFIVKKKITA